MDASEARVWEWEGQCDPSFPGASCSPALSLDHYFMAAFNFMRILLGWGAAC